MSGSTPPLAAWASDATRDHDLRVARASIDEALNRPWRIALELVEPHGRQGIDPARLLGAAARLELTRDREARRTFTGIVLACDDLGHGSSWHHLRVTLAAGVAALDLRRRSRVLLDETVPAILADGLRGCAATRGLEIDTRLRASYQKREQVVQWQESDLAFISRLAEHDGIAWWCGNDGHAVLCDHPDGFPEPDMEPLPQRPLGSAEPVHDHARQAAVWTWEHRLRLVAAGARVRDWNWRNPDLPLDQHHDAAEDTAGGDEEFGAHHPDGDGGRRLAQLRAEELRCRRECWQGSGDEPRLAAGRVVRIARPGEHGPSRRWLITAARHELHQRLERGTGDGEATTYRCDFAAQPADRPWRPALATPRPAIAGVLNAVIDGAAGGILAEPDDRGLYRVKAAFDRSGRGHGNASRAVRLATPYSGSDHGLHLPLHPGAEVLLTHVNGDPDRPVIAAAVPNARNPSVVTSDNRSQSVLRTAGGNELVLDDALGTEVWSEIAKRDRRRKVGGAEDVQVAGNRTHAIGGSDSAAITGDRTLSVGRTASETVAGAKAVTVGGILQTTVGGAENHTVGGALAEQVGAARSCAVVGNRSASVGGDDSLSVCGDQSEKTDGKRQLSAKQLRISAHDEIALTCGKASLVLKKNGDVVIKGGAITITGSGKVVVKGSKVAGN